MQEVQAAHDRQLAPHPACAGPGAARVPRRRAGPPVALRHHLHPDAGGLLLPRDRDGCVEQEGSWAGP